MADPSELSALEALRTALAAITTAGGAYKSTVDAAEYHYRTWDEAAKAGHTVIGMVPTGTAYAGEFGSRIRCTCNVELVCHVIGTTFASCYQAIYYLIDDVVKAVNVDHTLGGNVFDSKVIAHRTDLGDQDQYHHLGKSGTAVITVQLLYDRTTSGS